MTTATATRRERKHAPVISKRVLDPLERSSEILFGIIMVLTFTASLRVARADRAQVREMMIGALGCNLAWGVIDGIMYLMSNISSRGHNLALLRNVRRTAEPEEANRMIEDELPPVLTMVLPDGTIDGMRRRMHELPEPPPRPKLVADDWRGALGVFLLVFLSTFPIVLPFMLTRDVRLAAHTSDAIAITMLFFAGHSYGRYAGHSPKGWGLSMVAIGAVMVGLCTALGG